MSAASYLQEQGFNDPYSYQSPGNNIWAQDNENAGIPRSGNDLGNKITDFFGITDTKANYERWLTELDRQYEREATNSARAWDLWYDSTKVQRLKKDIEAAGLNPWLALQSGMSVGGSSSTAGSGGSARAVHSAKGDKNLLQSVGMFMVGTAKLLTALAG